MRTPTITTIHAPVFGNISTTFLIILGGVLAQAFISIYVNPVHNGGIFSKKGNRTMTEPSRLSAEMSRGMPKDGDEDPSTIQNKFMVGYQGW
jgi:hypothetical protein